MKNKKKRGFVVLWVSIVVFISSLCLFIIGCNSQYLISDLFRRICLIFVLLSCLCIIYGIILIVRYFHRPWQKMLPKVIVSVIVGVYTLCVSIFLMLLYSPYEGFRDWLITTAMGTMNHQYLCKWFYSDEKINEVLKGNYINDDLGNTDASLVDHEESLEYVNEYEKIVLEHDPEDVYKLVEFEVNGCQAYLTIIYDPSLVSVGVTKYLGTSGQFIYDMALEQGATLAINGGGFYDPEYNTYGENPLGITISNGEIITDNDLGGYGLIGINNDNTLVLMKNVTAQDAIDAGVRDAVTMGPFLIVNGNNSYTSGNGGYGYAARTAIGQRKDGIILMLVVDSNEFRTKGASMVDLQNIMSDYGAINAAALDGGTSSAMVINGTLINDPIDSTLAHKTRGIPTIFKVVEK